MPHSCSECQTTIPEKSRRRKFCSDKCSNRFHSKKSYHRNKKLKGPSHPNLREDYFKSIDTKDKAYWLGFLCADGHVNKNETQVQLHLSVKDDDQIDRFITAVNANSKKKRYYGPYETAGKSVQIQVTNRRFVSHLVDHGCNPSKTDKLHLPSLASKPLDLAFLMGLFDGDGKETSTSIFSSNQKLLKQIKGKYKIKYNIIAGETADSLSVGSKLFKTMIRNYPASMPRKRKISSEGALYGPNMTKTSENHCITCGSPITLEAKNCKLCAAKQRQKRKFDPEPKKLKEFVWEMPVTRVAKHFGVSGNAVKKRCKKYGIETPGRGYWQKKRAGKL